MKGAVSLVAVILITALASLVITGAMMNTAFYRIENIMFTLKDIYIISEINRFETIKLAIKQAAKYSFFQAMYDICKRGGYKILQNNSYNEIAIWRNYTKTYYPNYLEEIEKASYEIFKEYKKELENSFQKLSIPDYEIKLKENPDKVIIKLESGSRLSYFSPKIDLTLWQSNLRTEANTQLQKLFNKGKQKFLDEDPILKAIETAVNSLPKECYINTSKVCECRLECPSPEEICPNWKEEIKNKIRNELNNLEEENGISVEIFYSEKDIKLSYSVESNPITECLEDIECGCKTEECIEYYPSWEVECSYRYYAAVRILVSITDEKNIYPVYDEDTDYRKVKLKFYIISGNRKLI